MTPKYFDIHSHLFFKDFDADRDVVVQRMKDEGVWTLMVGTDLATSQSSVEFCEGKEGFFATIGLHPNHTVEETYEPSIYGGLVTNPKVVAIGECGIDYFRIEGDIAVSKKRQYEEFEKQMEFAITYDKPMMIHARPTKGSLDAYLDMADMLESRQKSAGGTLRGTMHFFVGNVDVARKFYSLGFSTSFTGVLTFSHDYDEVVKYAPLDMLMTETDSPFAAPAPMRGRRNEPLFVKYVVEAIARIREMEIETIRQAVVGNALRTFCSKP